MQFWKAPWRVAAVLLWFCLFEGDFIQANPIVWSRLRSSLLDNGYDTTAIPSLDNQGPLSVTINVNLQIVIDLDQRQQILKGISQFGLFWIDNRLIWNPEDYGNITSLSIPVTQMWTPPLVLRNSASADNTIPMRPDVTNVLVKSTGAVSMVTRIVHSSFCFLDLTWFPYDKINCHLVVTAPNVDEAFLILQPGEFISESPYLSHEWNIVSLHSDTPPNIDSSNAGASLLTTIFFLVGLERMPQFYLSSIVLPILLLELIGIVTFWIPLKSGERISACLSTILGLTVFQIVMADTLPRVSRTEQRPIIFDHACMAFIILVSIMLASLITTNISYSTRPVKSTIVRTLFFRVFATIVFMRETGRQRMKRHGNRIEHQTPKDSGEEVTYVQPINGQEGTGSTESSTKMDADDVGINSEVRHVKTSR